MIKLLGSIFIAGAAAWLGFSASQRLRRRVRALDELAEGLRLFEQELEFSAPELEEISARLGRAGKGAGGLLFTVFGGSLSQLGEKSAAQLWEQAVGQLPELTLESRRLLCALGECLGRFESREQRECVSAVRERLEQLRERDADACREKCRVCHALALSGGAFLVVLLL